MELIFGFVTDPVNSFFKEAKSVAAEAWRIYCERTDCPLRAKGQCTYAPILGWDQCPYGKVHREKGFTRNARKYGAWRKEQLAALNDVPRAKEPPERLAFIGDYVYLPYPFMDMVGGKHDRARLDGWSSKPLPDIPWLAPAQFFSKSCRFIPRTAWTFATVLRLLDGKPEAFFGGIITDYQEKTVPLFKRHLAEADPDMWAQVIAARPELDQPPIYVGRKALLRTLKPGITIKAYKTEYPVTWYWNGNEVITTDRWAYNDTWGHLPLDFDHFELHALPKGDAVIVVEDADWVTPETVFVD